VILRRRSPSGENRDIIMGGGPVGRQSYQGSVGGCLIANLEGPPKPHVDKAKRAAEARLRRAQIKLRKELEAAGVV
jgi:hypothetical protein